MSTKTVVPYCIGQFDNKDDQCAGKKDSSVESERAPCGWYLRCMVFGKHLSRTGKNVEDYFEAGANKDGFYAMPKSGYVKFVKLCNALVSAEKRGPAAKPIDPEVERLKRKPGRPSIDKRYKGPTAKVKLASKKALAALAQERSDALYEMFEQFKLDLAGAIGGNAAFPTDGRPVRPGQLYSIDRAEKSGYISVRCKSKKSVDVPVVLLKCKPAKIAFDFELPVSLEDAESVMSEETKKMFAPMREINSGVFKSASMAKIDKHGLFVLSTTIARLVNKGLISLPIGQGKK